MIPLKIIWYVVSIGENSFFSTLDLGSPMLHVQSVDNNGSVRGHIDTAHCSLLNLFFCEISYIRLDDNCGSDRLEYCLWVTKLKEPSLDENTLIAIVVL